MSDRALAASVMRLAVEDLNAAYKKVTCWDRLHKSGRLKVFVKKHNVGLTMADATAIEFFGSKLADLYCSIVDISPDAIPRTVLDKQAYLRENTPRLVELIRKMKKTSSNDTKSNDEENFIGEVKE